MISTMNHQLFSILAAPPNLHGVVLLIAMALAEWTILSVPVGLALVWLLGQHDDRRSAVAAAATALVGLTVAAVLSSTLVSPRPFMDGAARNYLDHVRDNSFPSDHATLLFGLAVAFWIDRPPSLPWLWLPTLALAVAVGWARVFLGAHYPADVAGAALVAAMSGLAVSSPPGRWAKTWMSDRAERTRSYLSTLLPDRRDNPP